MKPIDYSLYNRVKEKFPPIPFTIIFVSLAPDNLQELKGIPFTIRDLAGLSVMVGEHSKDLIPYAAIGSFTEEDVGLTFCCEEFEQEEDLVMGKITELTIGTYNNDPVDIEALKKEMQSFHNGILLSGNA